jgi:hypothetical protein
MKKYVKKLLLLVQYDNIREIMRQINSRSIHHHAHLHLTRYYSGQGCFKENCIY